MMDYEGDASHLKVLKRKEMELLTSPRDLPSPVMTSDQ